MVRVIVNTKPITYALKDFMDEPINSAADQKIYRFLPNKSDPCKFLVKWSILRYIVVLSNSVVVLALSFVFRSL